MQIVYTPDRPSAIGNDYDDNDAGHSPTGITVVMTRHARHLGGLRLILLDLLLMKIAQVSSAAVVIPVAAATILATQFLPALLLWYCLKVTAIGIGIGIHHPHDHDCESD